MTFQPPPTRIRVNHPVTTGSQNATFVRFEDEAGTPLPNRNVVIKVSATTGEIIDIVSEA